MFIEEIKVTNFKCFGSVKNPLKFNTLYGKIEGSGLNILVENNNIGEPTTFEAMYLIKERTRKGIESNSRICAIDYQISEIIKL